VELRGASRSPFPLQSGTLCDADATISPQSERYFGKDGARIFKERTLVLRPKVEASSSPAHDLAKAVDAVDAADPKPHYADHRLHCVDTKPVSVIWGAIPLLLFAAISFLFGRGDLSSD